MVNKHKAKRLEEMNKEWNKKLQHFKTIFDDDKISQRIMRRRASYYYNGKGSTPPDWIYDKEIRIFKMPGVDKRVVPYVTRGIEDLIKQIGLDFKISYYGSHPSVIEQVNGATGRDGKVDGGKLLKIACDEHWRKPEYGGSPHADVYVADKFLSCGDKHWGCAYYPEGAMVLALPKERQNSFDFMGNIAKHETGHLLGYGSHHDRTDDRDYEPVSDCNMFWRASTRYICPKCLDALLYFWKGIEARTRKKFFK